MRRHQHAKKLSCHPITFIPGLNALFFLDSSNKSYDDRIAHTGNETYREHGQPVPVWRTQRAWPSSSDSINQARVKRKPSRWIDKYVIELIRNSSVNGLNQISVASNASMHFAGEHEHRDIAPNPVSPLSCLASAQSVAHGSKNACNASRDQIIRWWILAWSADVCGYSQWIGLDRRCGHPWRNTEVVPINEPAAPLRLGKQVAPRRSICPHAEQHWLLLQGFQWHAKVSRKTASREHLSWTSE